MRPALLIIDMQMDYVAMLPPGRLFPLIAAINDLAGTFRGRKHPVFWVRQEFAADLSDAFQQMRDRDVRVCIEGTPGAQILPELTMAPTDFVLTKKRYSAFFETRLDYDLACVKPDTLVLAGINTHACIRTTAIDAYQRDWTVVIAKECVDSYDREHHDVSLRYMEDRIAKLMSNAELDVELLGLRN